MRNLILVLGDQLDANSAAFNDFDSDQDAVWMAEVEEEATHVWCHKQRLVFFFSAMRHFRDELRQKDIEVFYHELSHDRRRDSGNSFAEILNQDINRHRPRQLVVVLPGDYRVKHQLQQVANDANLILDVRPDDHFYCAPDEFEQFAKGRKRLVLETFYRQMRKKHDILMDGNKPVGGQWNFDEDNRDAFGKQGPGKITGPHSFRPDELTQSVMDMVRQRYPQHPGCLDKFDLPVTRRQAQAMLRDFIKRSLSDFGQYEDALWTDEPFLYHSRLSAPLNVKLLDPRDCVDKAVQAFEDGDAPINSVEGFVRQILGWREFVRGVYWKFMPGYGEQNEFGHDRPLPRFFWDGDTDMRCVHQSMQHVLDFGYAHHIHRLMILGNLALMLGVDPQAFHQWHMAMYTDAVDWVSLPNALGMSQHAEGGIVGTKPYVSTGNYINRMSNFCGSCPYNYQAATGKDACPFTTLYWDFLDRHHEQLKQNHRMAMQLKNLDRKRKSGDIEAIRKQARQTKSRLLAGAKPHADLIRS